MEKKANSYVENKIDNNLRSNMINRLKWHQKKGHITILLSASLDLYIGVWGEKYNFNFVECTQLDIDFDKYNGKLNGYNCHGTEKVNRLNKLFGDLTEYELYGYGDSLGDKEFLNICSKKYLKTEIVKNWW